MNPTGTLAAGWPVRLNGKQNGIQPSGEEGRAAKSARAFAGRLGPVVGVPVEFVAEQFSTVEAEQVLLEADLSRARRKKVVDRLAAAVILQRFLDTRGRS